MSRLIPLALLIVLLSACGSLTPEIPEIPDPMVTGQLVVAFDPIQQGVRLTKGACESGYAEPVAITSVQDTSMRLYYFLDPGGYCLAWGWIDGAVTAYTSRRTVEIVAGAIEFRSVLPVAEPALETQPL